MAASLWFDFAKDCRTLVLRKVVLQGIVEFGTAEPSQQLHPVRSRLLCAGFPPAHSFNSFGVADAEKVAKTDSGNPFTFLLN